MRLDVHLATRGDAELVRALTWQLEALSRIDGDQLSTVPPLLSSGVRYRDESRRVGGAVRWDERWKDARTTLRDRHGDCEDLAAWMAAELVAAGHDARPLCFFSRPRLVHCVVWTPHGIADPSLSLGMPALHGYDPAAAVRAAVEVMGWEL